MEKGGESQPRYETFRIALPRRRSGAQGDNWDDKRSRPQNIHIHQPEFTPDEADGLFSGPLRLFPSCKDLIFLKFMQRSSVSTVWFGDERTGAEEVHDVEPVEPLLLQPCKERRNFVSDESSVSRRDVCAFDVFFLEPDTEGVDALKGQHRVLETVIHHANERHLIVQDPSNLLETSLALIGNTATVEVPPELAVKFVIPKLGDPDPISIIACRGICEAKLVFFGIEDHLDVFVAAHGPGQCDHSLLTVDEPTHERCTCGSRIPAACAGLFIALPEEQGRDRKTAIQRVNE